jgi:CHAD domain-containing protein
MAYRLEPDETLANGLRRVVVEQVEAAVDHLELTGDHPAGAVHEARKRSKEARAALRLLRGSLGDDARHAAREALSAAARRVATARDAEASVLTFEGLRHHRRLLRKEREPVEAALHDRRATAREGLTSKLQKDVARAFEAATAALPEVTYAAPEVVASALARIHRRGRDAMQTAYATGHDEAFHDWRHQTKDLWYAVRLFEGAWPGPLGALATELQSLSQCLGEEHDLTVLRAGLAPATDAPAEEPSLLTPRVDRAIERRRHELRLEARDAGARLWAESPRDFAKRILGYWSQWHERAGA